MAFDSLNLSNMCRCFFLWHDGKLAPVAVQRGPIPFKEGGQGQKRRRPSPTGMDLEGTVEHMFQVFIAI